ncbi:MAG: hypothetical protein KJ989_12960 [Gammaproteobacteria bacterium]|nr:hypothetical protein [Gammaproteobacteria bacterium]MBU2157125.1 hypothetical protein [Gammaproteobacteria bacterium]MBU2256039.1 hypothetical protein [Gammaproteobacteria bacterium]MBU2295107.1 hypothetical protein [Gammaproteobacteria bacterium]
MIQRLNGLAGRRNCGFQIGYTLAGLKVSGAGCLGIFLGFLQALDLAQRLFNCLDQLLVLLTEGAHILDGVTEVGR